jgi:hypothetical protein
MSTTTKGENKMNNNFRIIHTGLFSQTAYDAFSSIMGQLSDGYWENSPRMQKYWNFAEIKRADNGEVLVEVEAEHYVWDKWSGRCLENPYVRMSDNEILEFFANKMKTIAKVEMNDEDVGNQWQRDNEMKLHYLSRNVDLDVSDIYCIYDLMHSRNVWNRYPHSHVSKIRGELVNVTAAA